jgi:TrkA-N domain
MPTRISTESSGLASPSLEPSALNGGAQPHPEPRVSRRPLQPGRPVRGLWWLRSFGGRSPRSRGMAVALTVIAIGLTIGLGTWGFKLLKVATPLTVPLSFYRAVRLYTLDLGPAAGGSNVRPNWQLWVAFALAAALVLRGATLLWRERTRRLATRYVLRRHVVVCGGGLHGARLARELADLHDVVLIDKDANAPGMLAPHGKHEWRFVGDCVREETLISAGVARANWVIAMPGDDFVSSQVVSTVRSLAESGRLRDKAHVLAQIEDPTLARFLEEEPNSDHATERVNGSASSPGEIPAPVVSPFSANAIAAQTLLDEAEVVVDGSGRLENLLHMRGGNAPNILLAGDHPLIDALLLASLRGWRFLVLRDLESTVPHQRPPLHASVIGPGAVGRVDAFCARWSPEPEVMAIEARDIDDKLPSLEGASDWLLKPDRADYAIVACEEELDGVRLTLELTRALGGEVRMSRVRAEPESALDVHLEERTMHSDELATTSVKSLAELACRPAVMGRLEGRQRLADALSRTCSSSEAARLSAEVYERASELGLRSDSAWRTRPCERPILGALLCPVPVSALVGAGLRVDLTRPDSLRLAAERLSSSGSPAAFAAWCEYVRHVTTSSPAADRQSLLVPASDEEANKLMELRLVTLGEGQGPVRCGPKPSVMQGAPRVAIIAGAAGSMRPGTAAEIERLLNAAFQGYDGVVLSGATAVGVPGIVGAVARDRGLSRRLIGYAPEGRADRELYPLVHETPGATEFSVREPLAMWADIMQAHIPVDNVRLLAFPGNAVTMDEILLARALGARVAFVDPAMQSPDALDDVLPMGAEGVLGIPPDPMTLRAFLKWSDLPPEVRETVARYLHNDYRRKARRRKAPTDPALAPWNDLLPSLKESNRAQADDIPNKLALVGKKISQDGHPLVLTTEEIELLAEMEHGRWNIERLFAGWQLGERNIRRSVTPYLQPWAELDEQTRDYDRAAVAIIGPALADAGWGVVQVGVPEESQTPV